MARILSRGMPCHCPPYNRLNSRLSGSSASLRSGSSSSSARSSVKSAVRAKARWSRPGHRKADKAIRAEKRHSARRRSTVHPLLDRTSVIDRRAHLPAQILARAMARYVAPEHLLTVVELVRVPAGDRCPGRGRRRIFASGARGVQSDVPGGFCARAIRTPPWCRVTLMACARCWTCSAAARRCARLRPAADYQTDHDALAADSRRLRPYVARRAVRGHHLFGRVAVPKRLGGFPRRLPSASG